MTATRQKRHQDDRKHEIKRHHADITVERVVRAVNQPQEKRQNSNSVKSRGNDVKGTRPMLAISLTKPNLLSASNARHPSPEERRSRRIKESYERNAPFLAQARILKSRPPIKNEDYEDRYKIKEELHNESLNAVRRSDASSSLGCAVELPIKVPLTGRLSAVRFFFMNPEEVRCKANSRNEIDAVDLEAQMYRHQVELLRKGEIARDAASMQLPDHVARESDLGRWKFGDTRPAAYYKNRFLALCLIFILLVLALVIIVSMQFIE